jgi:hypothetical protein
MHWTECAVHGTVRACVESTALATACSVGGNSVKKNTFTLTPTSTPMLAHSLTRSLTIATSRSRQLVRDEPGCRWRSSNLRRSNRPSGECSVTSLHSTHMPFLFFHCIFFVRKSLCFSCSPHSTLPTPARPLCAQSMSGSLFAAGGGAGPSVGPQHHGGAVVALGQQVRCWEAQQKVNPMRALLHFATIG